MKLRGFAFFIGLLITPGLHAEPTAWEVTQQAFVAVFGELRQAFDTIIVEPEARDQAIRDLSRLSNRLRDVAIEKQQLTHDLVAATTPTRREAASRQAYRLQQSIQELRFSLRDFFDSMPPSWREKGGALERTLEETLGAKWERLQGIRDQNGDPISRARLDAAVRESKEIEAMLKHVREAVDALIVDLSDRNMDTAAGG